MSYYQDFDIPPPIDDEDSKCEENDFNDFDEDIDIEIPGSGIPQHHFYSSTPPPDDLESENQIKSETVPSSSIQQQKQEVRLEDCNDDDDEILNKKETVKIEDKNDTDKETESVQQQQPIKIESLDDDEDEFQFESFRVEGFIDSVVGNDQKVEKVNNFDVNDLKVSKIDENVEKLEENDKNVGKLTVNDEKKEKLTVNDEKNESLAVNDEKKEKLTVKLQYLEEFREVKAEKVNKFEIEDQKVDELVENDRKVKEFEGKHQKVEENEANLSVNNQNLEELKENHQKIEENDSKLKKNYQNLEANDRKLEEFSKNPRKVEENNPNVETNDEKIKFKHQKVDESDTKLQEFSNNHQNDTKLEEFEVKHQKLEEFPQNHHADEDSEPEDHFESFKAKGFSESDEFVFETFQSETIATNAEQEVQFEADFSNFETAFPQDSQIISHSIQNKEQEELKPRQIMLDDDNDDEDDFGDFNDFTQAPTTVTNTEIEPPTPTLPSILTVKPDIGKIIDQSFPYDKDEEQKQQQQPNEDLKVLNWNLDNLMKYLIDIDVTLALNYDYKDSCTNNVLVKALGIDKRNILFGPKWNSSSSNVPRFASDLSFNPLQPQKSSSSTNNTVIMSEKSIGKDPEVPIKPQQPQPDVIPEVDFDWNGAGLKNPLDAHNCLLDLEHLVAEKMHSNAYNYNNTDATHRQFDSNQYAIRKFNTKQIKPAAVAVVAEELNKVIPEVFESNLNKSEKINATEEETLKHMWTATPDESAFDIPSNHVIVRERVIKLPETHIFTPIKSVSPVAVSKDVDEGSKSEKSIYVKEYHDIEYSLEPPKYNKSEPESDFNEFQSAVVTKPDILKPQVQQILQPQSISNSDVLMPQKVNYTPKAAAADPVDDFDFAEFQTAPCVVAAAAVVTPPKEKEKVNSITLSPMHLVNNSNSKSKYLNNVEESNCDDDWSDFVSSTAPATARSNNDWSDFVSVPIKPSITNSSQSQFPAKPNFSSWNQPVSRPYAVNHTTSFLSSYQPDMSDRKINNNSKPMNITNNFNYGVDQQRQHGMSNGISTILPDLQFAIPNNLINLSRANSTNSSTSGKK